jgi:hypothetical protein
MIPKNALKVFIEKQTYSGVNIYMHIEPRNGKIGIVEPLTITEYSEDEIRGKYFPPVIHTHHQDTEFLQSLVDQAWDMGIRPRYARETTPEVNAIKYHLEDMRSLVFKKGK